MFETESSARSMYCPQAFATDGPWCKASHCMAWRRVDGPMESYQWHYRYSVPKAPPDDDGNGPWMCTFETDQVATYERPMNARRRGFCGLINQGGGA